MNLKESKKNTTLLNDIAGLYFLFIVAFLPLYSSFLDIGNVISRVTLFNQVNILIFIIVFSYYSFIFGSFFYELYQNKKYHIPVKKLDVSLPEYFALAYGLFIILSAIFSPHQHIVWSVWIGRFGFGGDSTIIQLGYVLAFLMISSFFNPSKLHLIIFSVSAFVISLGAILQFVGTDPFGVMAFYNLAPITSIFYTTLGNINIVSAYASIVLAFVTVLFLTDTTKLSIIYYITGVSLFAMLLIAGSYGGWLGLLVVLLVGVPFWLKDKITLGRFLLCIAGWVLVLGLYFSYLTVMQGRLLAGYTGFHPGDISFLNNFSSPPLWIIFVVAFLLIFAGLFVILKLEKYHEKLLRKIGIIVIPAVIVLGIIMVLIVGPRFSSSPNNPIWQLSEILRGRPQDHFATYRFLIWRISLPSIWNNPWFGTGPDTFYPYATVDTWQYYYDATGDIAASAHNRFMQIAATSGIPALIIYLGFLASMYIGFFKELFSEKSYLYAFGFAALAYASQSVILREAPIITPMVWGLFGGMVAMIKMTKE